MSAYIHVLYDILAIYIYIYLHEYLYMRMSIYTCRAYSVGLMASVETSGLAMLRRLNPIRISCIMKK